MKLDRNIILIINLSKEKEGEEKREQKINLMLQIMNIIMNIMDKLHRPTKRSTLMELFLPSYFYLF